MIARFYSARRKGLSYIFSIKSKKFVISTQIMFEVAYTQVFQNVILFLLPRCFPQTPEIHRPLYTPSTITTGPSEMHANSLRPGSLTWCMEKAIEEGNPNMAERISDIIAYQHVS